MSENDIAILNDKLEIFNLDSGKVERPIDTIEWDIKQAEKGKFHHFMLKEICEQADIVKRAIKQDRQVIDQISDEIRKAKGLYFVA